MTRHIPKLISAFVGLALLGVGAWLVIEDQADHGAGLLAIAATILGALGTVALPRIGEKSEKEGE